MLNPPFDAPRPLAAILREELDRRPPLVFGRVVLVERVPGGPPTAPERVLLDGALPGANDGGHLRGALEDASSPLQRVYGARSEAERLYVTLVFADGSWSRWVRTYAPYPQDEDCQEGFETFRCPSCDAVTRDNAAAFVADSEGARDGVAATRV